MTQKPQVGKYNGVHYHRRRAVDVGHASESRAWFYWLIDEHGAYTGDHFATIGELRRHLDNPCLGLSG